MRSITIVAGAVSRIPCHDSPQRFLPHAAANARPASASGFFQQEYAEGHAVYCSAPATVAFIGIGGISLAVTVPVPESSIMRIQITPQVQRRTSLPRFLLSSLSRPFRAVGGPVATVSPYRLCHTRCNSLMRSAQRPILARSLPHVGAWRTHRRICSRSVISFDVILAGTDDFVLTMPCSDRG
ncbi:hypothetical protein EDB86DRAFT_585664 [Lactarius hatsudake]|nr:hypothetical protein EDB86DRAFT_585664 [Lactarius hatsudake]